MLKSSSPAQFKPIKLIDIELTNGIDDISMAEGYRGIQALIRLHGMPIGSLDISCENGGCSRKQLIRNITDNYSESILRRLLLRRLGAGPAYEPFTLDELLYGTHSPCLEKKPKLSVVVCTRDRTEQLALCLDALNRIDYPNADLLVIDNSPRTNTTEQLVKNKFPGIRYILEPRPGLNWARSRAIVESMGEILAYVDDDAVVDQYWSHAMVELFAKNPEVMAATGLVVPYELETETQVIFEKIYGGFGKGFVRKWHQADGFLQIPVAKPYSGVFICGTGANMAYRREVFDKIGQFDPVLDVGTPTNGGGDLEMFFRVLKAGHVLVYEPAAFVRHIHRSDHEGLRKQLMGWGTGFLSYLIQNMLAYPDERKTFSKKALWWLWRVTLPRIFNSQPVRVPRGLYLAETFGALTGLFCFLKSRLNATKVKRAYGSPDWFVKPEYRLEPCVQSTKWDTGERSIDLSDGIAALTDVTGYARTKISLNWNGKPEGVLNISNHHMPIGSSRIQDAIVDFMGLRLVKFEDHISSEPFSALLRTIIYEWLDHK